MHLTMNFGGGDQVHCRSFITKAMHVPSALFTIYSNPQTAYPAGVTCLQGGYAKHEVGSFQPAIHAKVLHL
jgi:hypothetical protein